MARIIISASLTFAVFTVCSGTLLAASDDGLVYCFDQDRDLVTRVAAVACLGRIVDKSVAEQVRQRRIQRIRGQINQASKLYPNRRRRGSGSGFFVTPAGKLLTNNHVIAKCGAVSVQPRIGQPVRAQVIQRDAATDLALLQVKLNTATTPIAVFRNSPDRIGGGTISVVGFPLHGRVAIKPIFITGRAIDAWTGGTSQPARFRIKADIRRGNSGGPVMDVNGLVIGVVTAKINTPQDVPDHRSRDARYRHRHQPASRARFFETPQGRIQRP
jgi:S1-C subfamily serine protease